jgi:hypothetical protein
MVKKMKKKIAIFLLSTCIVMTGCSNEKSIEENQAVTEQADVKTEDKINNTVSEPESEGDATQGNLGVDILEGQIKEQSFDIELDSWGNVTFASFLPVANENGDGDVQFRLLSGKDIIYHFPGITEDNLCTGQTFKKVIAVAFNDYNKDGKRDVIIINEYAPQSGPNKEDNYKQVRVYTQENEKKEFIIDSNITEYLNKYFNNETIDSAMEGITKYQKEMGVETVYYGDYSIVKCVGTAQVYAMSQDEIEEVIGNALSYAPVSFAWNGNTMSTSYSEKTYSANQFSEDFGIQASELGMKEKEFLAVSVLTEGNFIGQNFYVIDENNLLVYYEGVFFKAERSALKTD